MRRSGEPAASTFPWFRVWLAIGQPCFRHTSGAEYHKFGLTLPTVVPSLKQEALRFVSTALHSLPYGWKYAQSASARASSATSEEVYLKRLVQPTGRTPIAGTKKPAAYSKAKFTRGTL